MRIANVDGSVAESLDYTAFGDRRAYGNPGGAGSASTLTPRGFTGHESVDGMQVIHMNGRIYDPQLGRFLQPDPVIQEPTNAQSWNAYTYVFNNPLAYTDPTGMMSERAWNNVWRGLGLVISIISMGATSYYMGISTQAGITAAAAGGFFAGYAATGTMKSAVIGAFSAAITAGIAGSTMNGYEQMAAQAVTGGVVESLQGGSFGHGFVAAGLTAAFMPQVGGYSAPVRTALGALIGGTISAVTGGKFANGAISGAVQGAMAKTSSLEGDSELGSADAQGEEGFWEGIKTGFRKMLRSAAYPDELNDPRVQAAMRKAYAEADVHSAYNRKEQGGFYGFEVDGTYGTRAWEPGDRGSIRRPKLDAPGLYKGLRILGDYHVHPNPLGMDEFGTEWRGNVPSSRDLSNARAYNYPRNRYIIGREKIFYINRYGRWGEIGNRVEVIGE